jgi:gamma-glutamyltranspeptidase/glutathione hydrolase
VADGCNTGLGGYRGHMVIVPPGGEATCVDFDMWVPVDRVEACRAATLGPGPVATVVPNVVAGLARALADFGSLGWAEVSAPAIACARDGVAAGATMESALVEVRHMPFFDDCFALAAGDDAGGPVRVRQPALARTLEAMAEHGPGWFHEGPIADSAVAILRAAGHPVDGAAWREAPDAVRVGPPAMLRIGDVRLWCAPLGTSGSLSMFATLRAGADHLTRHGPEAPGLAADWARSMAALWGYRFGTAEGNAVAQDGVDDWIGRALAFTGRPDTGHATGHTCHLNAVDAAGMAVAVTLTHGPAWFGARWAVPGTGVIMNAGMHLLQQAPPRLHGGRAYAVTNMSPTVAHTGDGSVIAIGCPGARRIPSIVAMVLARHLFGGQSLGAAISAGRLHAESAARATIESARWAPEARHLLAAAFPAVETENPKDYYGPLSAIRWSRSQPVQAGLDDRSWPAYAAFA